MAEKVHRVTIVIDVPSTMTEGEVNDLTMALYEAAEDDFQEPILNWDVKVDYNKDPDEDGE